MTRFLIRGLITGVLAVGLVGIAAPAFAQNGTLKGKVVLEEGGVGIGVEVILEQTGDGNRKYNTITDKFGEWVRPGVPVGTTWKITAKLNKLSGETTATVKAGDNKVTDIVLMTPESRAAGKKVVSQDEHAKAAKRSEEITALTKDIEAGVAAGNFDDALAKLKSLDDKIDKCWQCQMKMAEILFKKKDEAGAEAALNKAVEYAPPTEAEPYRQLANLYNNQRKFDEAAKMNAKVSEIASASGGGGDANSFLNQGKIFWNAGKIAEAKDEFAKAVKVDPKIAESHYWLGLTTFSLASTGKGTLADAKGPFSEYLKLDPKGEYAEIAKSLLAQIK